MLTQKQLLANIAINSELKPGGFKRRPAWEYALVSTLFLVIISVGLWMYFLQIRHIKEMYLHSQLLQIRNSILMYYVVNKEMPPSLEVLAQAVNTDPKSGESFHFLNDIMVDSSGRLTDPLGYPYRYNPTTGDLSSSAPCCEKW